MANQQPVDFQDTLMTQDYLKRSTDLPLFHADVSKDKITRCRLIKSAEIADNIASWDDKRKVQELASILCGWTQAWWDSLEIFHIDEESWDKV